ncbi:MAG: hypothetical protein M1818_004357 [Claussenomyces sp. TS43310]|nr:MAG: hypothetical protein M1818_004357 [Claussenomyces sp. TS43310]
MASSLNIALQNQSSSSTVYAYISGLALNNNNAMFLLRADGKTPYFPTSPSSTGTPLAEDCGIPLGTPGTMVTATIPQLAGGRIWFSIGGPLTFLLNPGPALVEPSVTNPSDPNIHLAWDFCEFTFNSAQLFANISYVDFVCLPISLTLTNAAGATQKVSGTGPDGLATVCAGLKAQQATDGVGWDQLIVSSTNDQQPLRALSPNNAMVMNGSLFSGYYDAYVNDVWTKLARTSVPVDTQAAWGTLTGQVVNNKLTFGSVAAFSRPSTADIFSCSTGPFTPSPSPEVGALIARVSAAFNRSTLLLDGPAAESLASYYANPVTNHYARVVHAANLDAKGYAFPFDDVSPTGGADQSGKVEDGAPVLLTVAVGGNHASAS